MKEKFLYVVSDFNDYVYVVMATSNEDAIDLVNYHTGQDKEDWIVNLADNDDGKIIIAEECDETQIENVFELE